MFSFFMILSAKPGEVSGSMDTFALIVRSVVCVDGVVMTISINIPRAVTITLTLNN